MLFERDNFRVAMLTKKIRNDIDKLWKRFWTDGITNPLTVIEQISYLMFARMLDIQEDISELKENRGVKVNDWLFPRTQEGQLLRWKNFKYLSGKELHQHLKSNVYPQFSQLGQNSESSNSCLGNISEYMQDAKLEIKNEFVLVYAVDIVDRLPLTQSDIKGDVYEFLLSKLTTAGINGQFRTPRHIIDAMIEMINPLPTEIVCDPACGTAGFLARTREYLNRHHSSENDGIYIDEDGNKNYLGDLLEPYKEYINTDMFWGFDFDSAMLRVSSMNMSLHGVNGANIKYQDCLNKSIKEYYPEQEQDFFDVILANPPFKGSQDESSINPDLLKIVKTKKTELLFIAHILRALKCGGRAAVIVPDGVLFGSSIAHVQLRQNLIEKNQLEGVVSLPNGVFKPYTGVGTSILIFSKGGKTDRVWFYDVQTDGYSLDDKRTPLSGVDGNDLPDVVAKWKQYRMMVLENTTSYEVNHSFGDKANKAFIVDVKEIIDNKFDLSINRYKEVAYERVEYADPKMILAELRQLENEILQMMYEIEENLN